jgi:transcriptional regulator with XRE-family HTH domain
VSGISWAAPDPGRQNGSAPSSWQAQEAREAEPALGDILRQARRHRQLTLRQVEQRISLPNAHLSQIERGSIRRPDPAILMDLAELYGLNYRLIAEWAGYLDPGTARTSGHLAGLALRMFVELDPAAQRDALEYIERLRNQSSK